MKVDINKELPALAIMTAVGYLSCYMFQFGLFASYGIPVDLASVDVNSLLFSMFLVFFFSFVIIFPVIFFVREWRSRRVRRIAFSYTTMVLIGISYYISSVFLGYYSSDVTDFNATKVFIITFLLLSFFVGLLSASVYFGRKAKEMMPSNNVIITRTMLYVIVLTSIIGIPMIMGMFYSKFSIASIFYKNTDYFFVIENSKGIIVARCNENSGVSFKRIKSDEADFNINYQPRIKIKVKSCIERWGSEKIKVVGL